MSKSELQQRILSVVSKRQPVAPDDVVAELQKDDQNLRFADGRAAIIYLVDEDKLELTTDRDLRVHQLQSR